MEGIQLTYNKDSPILEPTVRNGHLQTGDILRQNQALILTLHHGELKENPSVGVGISDMLLDNAPIYWRTLIKEQMEMDGQTVDKVRITNTGVQIESKY